MLSSNVIDFETTSLNPYTGGKIFAYVITNEKLESNVYRLDESNKRLSRTNNKILHNFMHDEKIAKVAHNASFEMGYYAMHNDGVLPTGQWEDTLLANQLLKNLWKNHKLEKLSQIYCKKEFPNDVKRWDLFDRMVKNHMMTQNRLFNNYPERFKSEIIKPLIKSGITPLDTSKPNYGLIPRKIMDGYQLADGERGMFLWLILSQELKRFYKLYEDYRYEVELARVAQKMRQHGIHVHKKNCLKLIDELQTEVNRLEERKRKIFGFNINLKSPDQLQKHLFGYINKKKHENNDALWKRRKPVFDFDVLDYTDTYAPSTGKETMLKLMEQYPDEEVFELLNKYRSYTGGVAMVTSYFEKADENMLVYPNQNTNIAATGRQSVSDPNLQNVQKPNSINALYKIPARGCFDARKNYRFLTGDYSGIEMRLIISATNNEELIYELNKNPEFDVHAFHALASWRNEFECLSMDSVRRYEIRSAIKNSSFGIAYGSGIDDFANNNKVDIEKARILFANLKERNPLLCTFSKDRAKKVRKHGYIQSPFGRKLFINKELAYAASNYEIQHIGAVALKRGEINIDNYINDVLDGDYDLLRPLVTVHDEVILEMHKSLVQDKRYFLHDLNYCMTKIPHISVPLTTEWKISRNTWGNCKNITF